MGANPIIINHDLSIDFIKGTSMLRFNLSPYAVLVAALSALVLIPVGGDRETPAPIIANETLQLDSGQMSASKSSITAESSWLRAVTTPAASTPQCVMQLDPT